MLPNEESEEMDEMPSIPDGLEDTRDEGYCWRVVDGDGDVVTHLTMDWSAFLYEKGITGTDDVHIVFWEYE